MLLYVPQTSEDWSGHSLVTGHGIYDYDTVTGLYNSCFVTQLNLQAKPAVKAALLAGKDVISDFSQSQGRTGDNIGVSAVS